MYRLAVMLGVGNISPVEGISSTSKRWRFYLYYSSCLPLLAKLKLGRLCALLRALEVRTSSLVMAAYPSLLAKLKFFYNFLLFSFPPFLLFI